MSLKNKLFLFFLALLFSVNIEAVSKVCFQQKCFNIEVAKTKKQRAKGLSGRDYLPNNSGMLFVYPSKGYYSFWMKGMLFPLDILWLNERREVVTFYSGVPPCVVGECPLFSSNKQALYVLELPSGSIEKLNIRSGSIATFN